MLLRLALSLLAAPALAATSFDPVPTPEHRYTGGWQYFVGGGLASFDCNGDNLPELFAAGGSSPAILLKNQSKPNTAIKFIDGTPPELALTNLTGAYPIDVDSDGHVDLVLLSTGRNHLLQGQGDCRFKPFDSLSLGDYSQWSTAFSAIWETTQSLPTLAIGNYVDTKDPNGPFGACDSNLLYRPQNKQYLPAQTLTPGFCALSMLFSDWSRRAQPDLRISNDRHYYVKGGAEQLWRMADDPVRYTQGEGWLNHQLWGMGIASRDVTGDGLADVFLSSMGDQRLQLLANAEQPTYTDAPYDWGTTAHRPHTGEDGRPSTGWHTAFGDVNNDGLDDIFISKGNVEQMPGSAMLDPNSLLQATGPQRWSEVAFDAGVASTHRSRGAVLTDLNNDGLLDLAVNNRRELLQVWQNTTVNPGHWLSVKLSQKGPNRDAIGAWIEMKTSTTQSREITIGGGHAGGSLGPEHFGLGETEQVSLRVIWPDGSTTDWHEYSANQQINISR